MYLQEVPKKPSFIWICGRFLVHFMQLWRRLKPSRVASVVVALAAPEDPVVKKSEVSNTLA